MTIAGAEPIAPKMLALETMLKLVAKPRVEHIDGKLVVTADGAMGKRSGAERFEEVYGHFCAALMAQALRHKQKREPSIDELGAALKALFAEVSVDVGPWKKNVAQSADAGDQALLAALA